MSPAVLESATNAVSADTLERHLEWFSKVRRDTGGAGENQAAEYIAADLGKDGVPVTLHEYDAFMSYPIRATLEVLEPERTQIRCLTHSFARPTGPHGLATDLVHVDPADIGNAAGRAALIDGLATPVTVLRASRAGCSAVVFANQDFMLHNMIVTTIWGTPGIDQLDRLPQIPVVTVNKEGGETLKRLLATGRPVKLKLVTEVKTGWFRSKLPEVRIPGTDEPETFVLAGGHYCAWEVGITDNATGNASLMELARILWKNRASLRRSVRVCWWPGHSHGRYAGSTWYADTFFTDLAEHCIAYHNIDSPGVKGATTYIARHTSAEVETFCRDMIERVTGQAKAPIHRPSRAADQSFLANGVPAFSTYPFLPDGHPDRRPWTGGSANAWWWHSEYDTLDKGDKAILALDTRLSITAVMELANAEVLPIDHVSTAREISDNVTRLQESTAGHLDLTPVLDEAKRFRAAAERLEAAKSRAKGADARRVNETLMRLSRVLTPVIYSQGGRFQHDPAEWSPLMRATQSVILSALNRAGALPSLAGTLEFGFLRTQVVRERNRVVTALREATRLVDETIGR
jgi:N-acetylated-alpha-linked acidic dipeptidase